MAVLLVAFAASIGLAACSDADSGGDGGGVDGGGGGGSGGDSGVGGSDASGGADASGPQAPCDAWDVGDPGEGAIREYFARFQMPVERGGCTTLHRPHSENRWNVFYPGRCAGCGIPNHIGAASFGDTLIVSWVASAAYQDSDEPNKRKFGHLSTFTFTERGGFTKVSDFVFDACDHDMGEVAVSPDGSVIGALCLADRPDHEGKKQLILMEWTGGAITQTPDRQSVVSSSAGGWAGQWGLALNNDLTHYYIAATTVLDGGHRGMTRFVWDRQTGEKGATGSCGGGHPTTNRITHNRDQDTWSLFCRMDTKSINWVFNGTSNHDGTNAQFGVWTTTSLSDTPGGLHNGISLGRGGWLVAATGPFDLFDDVPSGERKAALVNQQIGLRWLPPSMAEFRDDPDAHPWRWIDLNCIGAPTRGGGRLAGLVQLHNFGQGGEDSGRILMGYSPTRGHTGAGEFHAVEIDAEGNLLHAPVVLQRGGWGIDNVGADMPGSGCVVFPYTWKPDDPEQGVRTGYPKFEEAITARSAYLKLTALCPSTNAPPAGPAPSCALQRSELIEAAALPEEEHQPECPAF